MSLRNIKHLAALILMLLLSSQTIAGTPTERVKSTVDVVLEILQQDIAENQKRDQVFDSISDNFHFPSMSKRILATNWRKASKEQKQQFMSLFRRLLVNTYWARIKSYKDENVEYTNEKIKKNKYARVDTDIVTSDKRIPIAYRMLLIKGEWLAYDVIIEGISLVQNFRNSYQSIVKKEGIDGLLTKMKEKLNS